MPKTSRYAGPSHADGTEPERPADIRGGADLELLGPEAEFTVGGNARIGGDLAMTGRVHGTVGGVVGYEDLTHNLALARWRQKLAVARSGGLSVQLLVLGDSISEGFATTRYRNRWIDQLRRRFQGARPGTLGTLPASAGVFSTVLDASWPGGDNPWTFTGGVTGNVNYGLGFHAVNIPASGTATITYFGDRAALTYVVTPTGPTAAAVTLDGVSVATIDANGSEAPGQVVGPFGTQGDFGFHTLTVTPNDGTLILEGASWFDGDAPLFTLGSVVLLDATHAGFSAQNWAGDNNNWSASLAAGEAFTGSAVIALGVNDALTRTPAQYEDDLVTITERIDARLGAEDMGYLFVMVPGSQGVFAAAAWRAARRVGLDRAAVFDMAALRPRRLFGTDLEDDGAHPNDAGHIWMAEALGQLLDPAPTTQVPVTATQTVIDASLPATRRSSWTEAWTGLSSGVGGYDESGGGTTVGERRHRVWLDAGTYRSTLTMQEDTGLGTAEVLVGRWVGNTPTLTSCGTKANAASSPTLVTTRLATSITTQVAGWVPVIIRKTADAGAVRFVRLVLDKTA